MKKLLSLALALALCAGLTVPALADADGAYEPYTIAGTTDDGRSYSISFDAARAEQRSVQFRVRTSISFNGQWKAVFFPYAPTEVTVVTLEPGSGFHISPDGEAANVHTPLVCDAYDRYTAGSDLLSRTIEGNLFDESRVTWDINHYDGFCMAAEGGTYLVLYAPSGDPADPGFTDILESSPFRDAVAWAAMKNITKGTSASVFSGESPCTQNQLLTFLWRAWGSPAAEGDGDFAKAVNWARAKDLLAGDGSFDGDAPCTRCQAMVYLWTLAGRPETEPVSFIDVAPLSEYRQPVSWAVWSGIAEGTSASTFGPDDACTRGQIVSFLYRAMK